MIDFHFDHQARHVGLQGGEPDFHHCRDLFMGRPAPEMLQNQKFVSAQSKSGPDMPLEDLSGHSFFHEDRIATGVRKGARHPVPPEFQKDSGPMAIERGDRRIKGGVPVVAKYPGETSDRIPEGISDPPGIRSHGSGAGVQEADLVHQSFCRSVHGEYVSTGIQKDNPCFQGRYWQKRGVRIRFHCPVDGNGCLDAVGNEWRDLIQEGLLLPAEQFHVFAAPEDVGSSVFSLIPEKGDENPVDSPVSEDLVISLGVIEMREKDFIVGQDDPGGDFEIGGQISDSGNAGGEEDGLPLGWSPSVPVNSRSDRPGMAGIVEDKGPNSRIRDRLGDKVKDQVDHGMEGKAGTANPPNHGRDL